LNMLGETIYAYWAPTESIWTPWVKPVLFAQLKKPPAGPLDGASWKGMNIDFAPPVVERTALIIDLPGDLPLAYGLALAHRGYRPVVLYNCCDGPMPAIDLQQCLLTLCKGEQALARLSLARDAPPVFLLDSRRRRGERFPGPGTFNNRWITLPQDFPSGNFMQANGIRRAAFIQAEPGQPADDLAHVLRRWQETGMQILGGTLSGPLRDIKVSKPWGFRYAWYGLLATIGLRANDAGGFGARVPVPQSSYG
jgi:hypothetical protein